MAAPTFQKFKLAGGSKPQVIRAVVTLTSVSSETGFPHSCIAMLFVSHSYCIAGAVLA